MFALYLSSWLVTKQLDMTWIYVVEGQGHVNKWTRYEILGLLICIFNQFEGVLYGKNYMCGLLISFICAAHT
jgi:hypothetical protein